MSGRNWGQAVVKGSSLAFQVGGKATFEIECKDISGVAQQGRTDLLIEFAADDTAVDDKDSLMEMSFHVPMTSKDFPAPEKPKKDKPADGCATLTLTRRPLSHSRAVSLTPAPLPRLLPSAVSES